jgi:ribosomal protein S12 methylthiotransferase
VSKTTINLISLGCSKNLVDSEKLLGQLPQEKYSLFLDADEHTDVVIINTCGFIGDAKQESIDTILSYVNAKQNGLINKLLVFGCLSQRYRKELALEIPEVDAWFGVEERDAICSWFDTKYDPENCSRFLTTPRHYAYLKVGEGCNRKCSFCAIPFIRGPFRSTPVPRLVEEAQNLTKQGVKEILLIAQDLGYYGRDIDGKSHLAELLVSLSGISELQWIRLHYLYPANFPKDILPIMKDNPKICHYLDIPLQHASDNILKSMRRGHDKKAMWKLIENTRNEIPDIAIRTTMLVGFPEESSEDFSELMNFVREARFERLGVFTYSPEEGTKAFKMADTVSSKIKKKRAEALMALQQDISLSLNKEKIGRILKVIVDREDDDYFVGRTEYDSPEVDNEVLIQKADGIEVGSFIFVRITDAGDFELWGVLDMA